MKRSKGRSAHLDKGHELEHLLGVAALGEHNNNVTFVDDADVTMERVCGAEEGGAGACGHKDLRNLLCDEATLANASKENAALAGEHCLQASLIWHVRYVHTNLRNLVPAVTWTLAGLEDKQSSEVIRVSL